MKTRHLYYIAFVILFLVQSAHFSEHVAQVIQIYGQGVNPAEAHGLLGSVFDFEWVHFFYNIGLEVMLIWLWLEYRHARQAQLFPVSRTDIRLLGAIVLFQGYHSIEHIVKLYQYLFIPIYQSGQRPTPGILPQLTGWPIFLVHFVYNLIVWGAMAIALWRLRPPGLLATLRAALSRLANTPRQGATRFSLRSRRSMTALSLVLAAFFVVLSVMVLSQGTGVAGRSETAPAVGHGAGNAAVPDLAVNMFHQQDQTPSSISHGAKTAASGHTAALDITAAILPPNAVDDAEFTDPGTPVTIPVLDNDSDPQGKPLTVIAVSKTVSGTATTNGTTVTYTPTVGFSGIEVFTYTVSNGVLSNSAFVYAIVLPPPDTIWENDVFDSLTSGPLAGQNGWTAGPGKASPMVITDTDPARGKVVQIDATAGQTISVTKDVPAQTSGQHSFSFMVSVTGTTHLPCEAAIELQTDPSTGWSDKARFCIGPSIAVNTSPTGTLTTLVSPTVPGQWYFVQGDMNLNTNLLSVRVDGSLVASGIPMHPGRIRSLGITGQDTGGAGVVYLDNLAGVSANGTSGSGGAGGTGTPGTPVYWINPAGGLWSSPGNWSTGRVPTSTDHAIITLGGTYTVTVDNSTTVGSLTVGTGGGLQTLWIKGNGSHGNVTLTVINDIVDSGVILLESEFAGYQSNLRITSGVLINNRFMRVNPGSGGSRIITGRVLNNCIADIQYSLTISGTFTNQSMLMLSPTQTTMSLVNTTDVFNQNLGEIDGTGVLALSNGATLNFNRGATRGAAPTLTNAKLNFGPSASGVATFILRGLSGQLSGNIGAEQTVWIQGNGQPGDASITALNGFVNAGVIRLESQFAGYQSSLIIASGALANTGVISVNQGTGGLRVISGTLVNTGAVNVNYNLTFKGTFTNLGTLTIASGQTMSLVNNTDVFNQNAGTIAGAGVLALSNGATLNFNSGTTTGAAPTLTNAKLNFGPAATGVATFIMQGISSQLSGDIGTQQTVWIRGNGQPGDAIITALSSFVNAGVIRLESQFAGYQSNLTIASGVLTNTGVISVNQGTGGFRVISGTLVNTGAVNVNYNLTFKGSFTNLSTLTIASGQTMSLVNNADVFNQNAGTIAGAGVLALSNGATLNFNSGTTTGAAPTLTNAKLNFGPSATGVATFIMQGTSSRLSGDIGTQQTVWIRGNGQPGDAIITALSSFVNAGVIRLESQFAGYQSNLIIASGALTNTGVISVNQGTGGARVISGTLVNTGAVNVNYNLQINGVFTTSGILSIGLGPGNSEFDWLHVSGPAALSGALNLNVAPGFNPALGATFQIITCTPCSGTFATVNGRDIGNAKRLVVIYNPTNVTLQVAPEEAIAGLTATNNSPTGLGSATRLTATVTAGSNVIYTWNFGDGFAGSGAVVTHTYAAIGNYTTIVTATNTLNTLTATTVVNVVAVPITGLVATNNSPTTLGSATTLTATVAAGSAVSYAWNFGDGFAGSGRVVTHTYAAIGNYTAMVTATNSLNTATATTIVAVTDVPITGLSITASPFIIVGQTTVFTATQASGTNVSYAWSVNSAPIGSGNPISYTFTAPGTYTVTVMATNGRGSVMATRVVAIALTPRVYLPLVRR